MTIREKNKTSLEVAYLQTINAKINKTACYKSNGAIRIKTECIKWTKKILRSYAVYKDRFTAELTRKYIEEKTAIVQYLPQYASARTAPISGVT